MAKRAVKETPKKGLKRLYVSQGRPSNAAAKSAFKEAGSYARNAKPASE